MPSDVKFKEVERMLKSLGYTLNRVRGSHHVFKNQSGELIVIPVHNGKVKVWYVREIQKIRESRNQAGE